MLNGWGLQEADAAKTALAAAAPDGAAFLAKCQELRSAGYVKNLSFVMVFPTGERVSAARLSHARVGHGNFHQILA